MHLNGGMQTPFFPPFTASIERRGMGLCPMFTHRLFTKKQNKRAGSLSLARP